MKIFEQKESNVRYYCRNFPEIFDKAKGSFIYSQSGNQFIDFFAGCGVLNFGHSPDVIKKKLISYIAEDGICHGLDMHTSAKKEFILQFSKKILDPQKLPYVFQFGGPTGTNAIEAALKIARKVTGRQGIFSFMGGFHGMTLGSLSVTGSKYHRLGAGVPLSHVNFMPYPTGTMETFDTIKYMEMVINDPNSGIEKPAAILLETIQGEGGVNIAPIEWLQALRTLCNQEGILLICDEIQTGCYRTGSYFSFERAGIVPDLVVLSKALSGYGIPFSAVLLKQDYDFWEPGQHNGTFRGNQLAFVTAAAALEYAEEIKITEQVSEKEAIINDFIQNQIKASFPLLQIRGIGMIWGIDFSEYGNRFIKETVTRCFKKGLLLEQCGRNDTVLKLMPPLTIETPVLLEGLTILKEAMFHVNSKHHRRVQPLKHYTPALPLGA